MKILVIGPSWVGDMVMSQSLYKAIKANHPDSELHVMAPAWCGALLERMPEALPDAPVASPVPAVAKAPTEDPAVGGVVTH